MKRTILLLLVLSLPRKIIAQPAYSAAIARYEVIVSKEIRLAFEPHADDGVDNSMVKKYYEKGSASADGSYSPFDAMLTDTCITLLRHALKEKKISLDYKLPNAGLLSTYTPYNYPSVALSKAARIGTAQSYVSMEVKFSFKESMVSLNRDIYTGLQMTPHVSISITLADAKGKTIYDGNGAATANSPLGKETVSEKLQSLHTTAVVLRADESTRYTLLMQLFNQALTEVMFNLYH